MKALFYLLSRIYKNTLLQAIKKPATLIAYAIFILLIGINPIIILISGETREVTEGSLQFFSLMTLLIVGITVLPSLYSAVNKVTLPLRAADVNFLFTAPVRPSQILIYAQIIQSVTSLVVALLMLLQGPLLMQYMGVGFGSVVLFVLVWGAVLVSAGPVYMAIFAVGNRFPRVKLFMRICFFVYVGIIAVWIGSGIYSSGELIKGAADIVDSKAFGYLPLIGWYKALFVAVINGVTTDTIIIMVLVLITSIAGAVVMVKLADTSFYEEAIKTSEKIERIKAAQQAGDTSFRAAFGLKHRKVKQVAFSFKECGARTVRQKLLLEQKKRSRFFLDLKSLLCIGASVGVAYLINMDGDIENRSTILLAALIANAYAVLLFSMRNNRNELTNHYIYLIPDSIYSKLMAISFIPGLKYLLDATVSVLAVAVIFRVIGFEIILVPLVITVFGMQQHFVELILESYLGRIGTVVLRTYIKIFVSMLSILPGVIVVVILLAMDQPVGLALVLTFAFLAVVDTVLYLLAATIFKRPEMNA